MSISPQTLSLLQRIAAKLNEKSSVYGYAMAFAALFASKYQGDFAKAAAIISMTAGIALWALDDTQVRLLLTGQKPPQSPAATVPTPTDSQPKQG